jgi:hypothetical protein
MSDDLQTRAEPGAQIRSRLNADLAAIVNGEKLSPSDRVAVLELAETALTADRRDMLAGARLLVEHSDQLAQYRNLPSFERRSRLLRRLATAFVHPGER